MASCTEDRPVEMTFTVKENIPRGLELVNEVVCITAINWIPTTQHTVSWPKQIPYSTAQSTAQNKGPLNLWTLIQQ